jgi:uncharacterized protein involved in outer membrane biogenesis
MVLRGFLKFLAGAAAILLIVLAVVVVGGYFAAKGIDPNIFRTELENYLTQQTGLKVELGKIDLKWGGRLHLQADGLKAYNPVSLEKLLQSDSVLIEADLTAIWRRMLWMPKIVISGPEVYLRRKEDGSWNWQFKATPQKAVRPAVQTSSLAEPSPAIPKIDPQDKKASAPFWMVGLDKVEVRDGTIRYTDETIRPAFSLRLNKCDAQIIPKKAFSSIHGVFRGVVGVSGDRTVEWDGDLDILARTLNFQFRYDGDRVNLRGTLKLVQLTPQFEGSMQVRELDLETATPRVYKQAEYLSGILNADLRLSCSGADPKRILQSLDGSGTATIRNGALRNRNVIREVFEKMSPVIAVTGLLGGELPPEMAELIRGPDTPFQQASVEVSASQGVATLKDFSFLSADYRIGGKGAYGLLDHRINLPMTLSFSKSISGYFVQKIHEISFLCDRNGILSIPFVYSGTVPDAKVTPDLQYVGNRIIQDGAQQVIDFGMKKLSKFLEKKL